MKRCIVEKKGQCTIGSCGKCDKTTCAFYIKNYIRSKSKEQNRE